ncbi:hypothetical protein [Streptomyces sp. NPDC001919]
MIRLPAGRVTLADRRTRRSWAVDVGPFALGAVPVTRELYGQVTGAPPGPARGGRFDEHWSCRASVRRRSHPTPRIDDVGFRLARTLPDRAAGPDQSGSRPSV